MQINIVRIPVFALHHTLCLYKHSLYYTVRLWITSPESAFTLYKIVYSIHLPITAPQISIKCMYTKYMYTSILNIKKLNTDSAFIYTKQYALRIHYTAHLYITSPQISIQYIQYTECMYTKQYTLYSASVYHFSPNQHSVYTVNRMHVY